MVRKRAVAAVIGVLALTSCAPAPTGAATRIYADAEQLEPIFNFVSYDYNPVYSNAELAKGSDLVLKGTIGKISDGPQYGRFDDEMSDISSVVIELHPQSVYKDDAQDASRGQSIYVVTFTSAGVGSEEWMRALPDGTPVVFYGEKGTNPPAEPQGIDVRNHDAGRPAGAPLYVMGVQGLAVATGGDTVVWPMSGVTRKGKLEQALPDGDLVGTQLPGEGSDESEG